MYIYMYTNIHVSVCVCVNTYTKKGDGAKLGNGSLSFPTPSQPRLSCWWRLGGPESPALFVVTPS